MFLAYTQSRFIAILVVTLVSFILDVGLMSYSETRPIYPQAKIERRTQALFYAVFSLTGPSSICSSLRSPLLPLLREYLGSPLPSWELLRMEIIFGLSTAIFSALQRQWLHKIPDRGWENKGSFWWRFRFSLTTSYKLLRCIFINLLQILVYHQHWGWIVGALDRSVTFPSEP